MRDIRFRAWHCESKIMYSWDDLINRIGISASVFVETKQWKPMQYTGLKDKKGKEEVYAADIIRAIDPIALERGEPSDYVGVVVWSEKSLAWILEDEDEKFIELLCRAEQIDIIGNIHQN